MTRKEAYYEVKRLNLQDEIKRTFGKSYTNVSTGELFIIINNTKQFRPETRNTKESMKPNRLDKLIEVLAKKRILLQSEVDYINK